MAEFCTCDTEVCELHTPHNADYQRAEAQFENYLHNGSHITPENIAGQMWAWRNGWRACAASRDAKIASLQKRVTEQGFAIEQASNRVEELIERIQGQ